MKLHISIAVVVAVIVCLGVFVFAGQLFQKTPQNSSQPSGINLYANGTYGISFQYPSLYEIQEGVRTDRPHKRYAITLIHSEDVVLPVAGEGPTAITIDVYERDTPSDTLSSWVTNASESNFSLGDKILKRTTVGGTDALQFRWSGLYEGETTAIATDEAIIVISVTYMTPEDSIVGDYRALLDSLHLAN